MLRIVFDVKCNDEDAEATIAAIARLRGVKHVELHAADFDLDTPVEQFGLTTRPRNALLKARITTLRELTARSHYELRWVKNLGRGGLDEIEQRLKSIGLRLRPQTSGEFTSDARRQRELNNKAIEKFLVGFEKTRLVLRRLWMTAAQKGYVDQNWIDWHLVDIALRDYARKAAENEGIEMYPEDLPSADREPLILSVEKAC